MSDRNCCTKLRKNERDAPRFVPLPRLVKRNVVVITNYGHDLTGRAGEKNSSSPQNTFDVLSLGLDDIDLAIVDLGANLQSLAIIEALTHSKPAPPVIALVDEKDPEAMSELQRHGATACLTKPFRADALATLIENVCRSHEEAASCDKWGHVLASSRPKEKPDSTTHLGGGDAAFKNAGVLSNASPDPFDRRV